VLEFEDHLDWDRFWSVPEMVDFRIYTQGWFQVPIIYAWNDLVCEGDAVARTGAGNSH
jgi:hypothetical protein